MQMAGPEPFDGKLQFVDSGLPPEVRVLQLTITKAQVERFHVRDGVAQPIRRHLASDGCTVPAMGAADP
jgi:hypothetical protein